MKSILFFCLLCMIGFSQNRKLSTFYLNQDLKKTDSVLFHVKANSVLYKSTVFRIGDTLIYRLNKQYDFGKLNSEQYKSVKSWFNKNLDTKNPDQNIIILFKDSLLGYHDHIKSPIYFPLTDGNKMSLTKYMKKSKNYDRKQKRCKRFISKYNTMVLHTYMTKKNYNFQPKNYKQVEIPIEIKNNFFEYENYGVVILKPDGHYFFYKFLTQNQLEIMLTTKWTEFIKELNKTKNNPKIAFVNFISAMNDKDREDREKNILNNNYCYTSAYF